MKRLGILFVLLLFFISGCQTSDIKALNSKLNDFENGANQYEFEITIEIDVTRNEQTETVVDSMIGSVQKEPYYESVRSNNLTFVMIVEDDVLKRYTMNHNDVVNGIQLYSLETFALDSIEDQLISLQFLSSQFEVTKINRNEFKLTTKLGDIMSGEMMEDLKALLVDSDITEEEINDIAIELLLKFNKNSFEFEMTMNLNLNDIELEIRINALFIHKSFELHDFDDSTKFYPMSSNETIDSIDISQPILFTTDNFQVTEYKAYFEAGKYGFYSNIETENHTIQVYGQSGDSTHLRVFRNVYNKHIFNTDNISRFYNIPIDGYYHIVIDYPPSPDPYIIEVRKIESVTDGTETPTLTVTESGIYNYEIESAYDFFSIDFDLDYDAFVTIKDSNNNQLYYNRVNESYFFTVSIPESGITHYMKDANQLVYLHNPNGSSIGTLTIDIIPLVHATSPDESMLLMSDQFSDELVVTGHPAPIQYIAIEVTERKKYTFEFLMSSGDIEEVSGMLYKENGTLIGRITDNRSVALIPGKYYFKTSNDYDSIYNVRTVISDAVETVNHIDSLQSHNLLTGDLSSFPQFNGNIQYIGEYVLYYFTLSETTDVALRQDNITYRLYDPNGNRIDIDNLSGMFVYRLHAGEYFIIVIPPMNSTESHFPIDYSLVLFMFTGSGSDTSVYPFVEEIPFGFTGKTSTMDYTGDYDGYSFTLTETTTISISSSDNAILIRGHQIIYSQIENRELTLEAGTYTIMCNTNEPTWTVSVSIINP